MSHCLSLLHVSLAGNQLGVDEGTRLAKTIPQCPNLARLTIFRSKIGADCLTSLAKMATTPFPMTVHELNLGFNEIGIKGAARIASYIPTYPLLKTLDLQGNSLGARGATKIANVLPECRTLEELSLKSNNICDVGATSIAEAMPM